MSTQKNQKILNKINIERELSQAKVVAFTMRHF